MFEVSNAQEKLINSDKSDKDLRAGERFPGSNRGLSVFLSSTEGSL